MDHSVVRAHVANMVAGTYMEALNETDHDELITDVRNQVVTAIMENADAAWDAERLASGGFTDGHYRRVAERLFNEFAGVGA